MKLKLERLPSGMILSVSGPIAPEQVAVIKAGLAKIFKTSQAKASPHPVLIDLSALTEPVPQSERLAAECLALKAWFACQGHEVFVASPVPELGDVASLEQGQRLLDSAPAREAALLAACQHYVEKLERQKHAYEKKLSALESSATALRRLRKENSDLRKRIFSAENHIQSLVPAKYPSGAFAENAARLRTAELTLTNVLVKHGLLEARSS